MRAIHRKLLRDVRHLWPQVLSIAAVMGCAVMTISGLQSTIRSLQQARDDYFVSHRFADVFVSLERAPLAVGEQLSRIPGVGAIDLRIVRNIKLDVPGLSDPAVGHLVSIPSAATPQLDAPFVRRGRWVAADRDDEIMVSERFAELNHLAPGDSLGAVINGRWRRLHVVGIAISPEYVVEGAFATFGDSRHFAYAFAGRALFESAFRMKGAFNDVLVQLAPDADVRSVVTALDRQLAAWGGAGAYPRSEQLMVRMLENEFTQLRTNASVFSSFFLIVSAFLLNVVLSRLVSAQREELAALKAFGYTNGEVARHYMGFAACAVFAGAALGLPGGVWMGHAFTNLYRAFFRFPVLESHMDLASAAPGIVVGAVFAMLGAVAAVRRAASMPPAQALRPESPGRMRPLLLERLGFGHLMSPSVRLVLRNLERRPMRTLTSSVGVGLAIAVLIAGRFPYDVFGRVQQVQFGLASREDFAVFFIGPAPVRAARELLSIRGVTAIEPFRSTSVRFRSRSKSLAGAITGYTREATLHRLVDVHGLPYALPARGTVLSLGLSRQLGLRPGDTLRVELLEQGVTRDVPVVGTIDEMMGDGAYMDIDALRLLLREGSDVSGAFIAVRAGDTARVTSAFKHYPGIAGASNRASIVRTFEEQTSQSILLVMGLVIFSAVLIAAGVVYNNARVAVSERGRELGSLRVLGYTRGELTRMLLMEQALITMMGIPIGLAFGRLFSLALAQGFTTDHYHFPFTLTVVSQALGVLLVVVTTALSSVVVWRLVKGLNVVSALKTRE